MKKWMTLLLAAMLMLSLAACAKEEAPQEPEIPDVQEPAAPEKPEVTLTAEELRDALKEALGDSYGCSAAEDADRALGYYGLDREKVESIVSDQNAISSVNMDMAVIVKVAEGYAEEAAAALQKGFDQKIGYARMYSMDLHRLGQGRLFVQDNYVALLVLGLPGDREAAEDVQEAAAREEAAKVDAAWEEIFGEKPENRLVIPEAQSGGQGGGLMPRPGVRPRG